MATIWDISIKYAQEILLDTKANAADIAIVVVALEYEMGEGSYNREMRWLPAAIVAMGRMKGM